jgi:hypothetical protein
MARAEAAGVSGQVTLIQEDFMTADVLAALKDLGHRRSELPSPTPPCNGAPMVVAMYLLQDALYRLQPSIQRCCTCVHGWFCEIPIAISLPPAPMHTRCRAAAT